MKSCKLNKVFLRALWLFLIASCSVFQSIYGQCNENYETATIFCVKDFNGQEAELSQEYFFRLQNIGRATDSLAIAFVGVLIPEKTVFFLAYETESLALQKKEAQLMRYFTQSAITRKSFKAFQEQLQNYRPEQFRHNIRLEP
jgi:hypothetical protein